MEWKLIAKYLLGGFFLFFLLISMSRKKNNNNEDIISDVIGSVILAFVCLMVTFVIGHLADLW